MLLLGLTAAPPSGPPANGTELLQRMHDAYAGKWYKTLTFVQKTSFPDGRTETWYEAAAIPGRLRIDVAPLDSQKTILFRADSIYQYENGEIKQSQAMIHPLMVLGFDVYAEPVSETAAKLTALGFDLGPVREDTWQGRKVWVVGMIKPDSLSREFWVDQERLLFVRMMQSAPRPNVPGKQNSGEIQFNQYQKAGDGWVAAEVAFFHNGERVQMEEYHDIKADPPLEPGLFDPGPWKRPAWVQQ
jgi:hypothetical protein